MVACRAPSGIGAQLYCSPPEPLRTTTDEQPVNSARRQAGPPEKELVQRAALSAELEGVCWRSLTQSLVTGRGQPGRSTGDPVQGRMDGGGGGWMEEAAIVRVWIDKHILKTHPAQTRIRNSGGRTNNLFPLKKFFFKRSSTFLFEII